MTDGSGTHDGHVEDWYTMHGDDHGDRLERITPQRQPDVPVHYPFDRDRN